MNKITATIVLGALCASAGAQSTVNQVSGSATGSDLLPVFRRAAAGAPLRTVLVGGSITQAGANIWVEDWLSTTFPDSAVLVGNRGMSATGSDLGVFRAGRDIVDLEPDLVFLEFAVNDGWGPDEHVIRNVESIVARLKSMPSPPAVVFLEAAARGGSNRARHQKVAAHYGLLDIDLQQGLEARLAASGQAWDALMSDDVHPNDEGHRVYGQIIAEALSPFVRAAKAAPDAFARPPAGALPPPLSRQPLLLDGTISPLPACQGWNRVPSLGEWWDFFFDGTIAPAPGTEHYHIPFAGTDVGLLFPLDPEKFGRFFVSVDGGTPDEVRANNRRGYTMWCRSGLEPGEHIATIFVPATGKPIHLGSLLVAGSSRTAAPGRKPPVKSAFRVIRNVIPLDRLEWAGPYGLELGSDPNAIGIPFPPETADGAAEWKPLSGDGETVDLAALTGHGDRGVSYIKTAIESPCERDVTLGVGLDYFGRLWVNGEVAATYEGGYGPLAALLRTVRLREGRNEILLKVVSGTLGNGCWLAIYEFERTGRSLEVDE